MNLASLSALGGDRKKMCVRPNHDKGVDRHLVEVLGFADDAEDDVGQFGRRSQSVSEKLTCGLGGR